jgi:hypothetical protein
MTRNPVLLAVAFDDSLKRAIIGGTEGKYDILTLDSAFDALTRIRSNPPDMVLIPTDFLIPRGGWSLADQIWETDRGMPIILVEGWEQGNPEKPSPRGPCCLLKRPVRIEQFHRSVEDLMGTAE